ncbi:hypothetical protein OESDEN_23650, partial [Oesophagostomum dentatum]
MFLNQHFREFPAFPKENKMAGEVFTAITLAVLIFGSAISVVVTVVLTTRLSDSKVVYFAMYLGDNNADATNLQFLANEVDINNAKCSFFL